MANDNIIQEVIAKSSNRRGMMKKLAMAAAAARAVKVGSELPLGAQSTPSPSDIVQFTLNIEYLENEFYSVGFTGQTLAQRGVPIDGIGITGPTTTSFGAVNFGNNFALTSGSERDVAASELPHIYVLRAALMANGITPIAKPPINLDALAAMGASLANQQTFLVLSRIFEDIGVSAYSGGSPILAGSPYFATAARILAEEGENIGNIRLQVARLGIPTFPLDGADILPPPTGSNSFSTNKANGLCAYRTPGQILFLAFGMAANATSGGFFPSGVNGVLNTSSGPATAANLA